jgi:predicted nucleotidyltransferase
VAGARSPVILFGSHAGDAAHPRSDVDFLVIESRAPNRREVGLRRAARLVRSTLAAVGVSVFDIAGQIGNSPEECMRTYVHPRSEDARYRVRRAVAEAARQVS